MTVLVTGAAGQLGTELVAHHEAAGRRVVTADRATLDVTDQGAVAALVAETEPDLVVHTAAFTKVDACETETERAWSVNAMGAWNVARAADAVGAQVVHISTDYVFDGTLGRPYTEFDAVSPLSMYGRSKEAGEQKVREACDRHFIVRTSWVHGTGGGNFARTMLRLARERGAVSVVDDQTGSPTFTADLVVGLDHLVESGLHGTYHLTNAGQCTWYEFARELFDAADVEVRLSPTDTASFGAPAPRPAFSVLDNLLARQIGLEPLPAWQESLGRFLADLD